MYEEQVHNDGGEGMMKFKGLMTSLTPHYATPKWLYDELDKEFNFDFDPCPLGGGVEFDGLSVQWGKRNFVNPPYGRQIFKWVQRCLVEQTKGNTVVALLPARTDTEWWHYYVMFAEEIRFIKGRLKFGGSKNSAPFPSCIVIFRKEVL